MQFLWLNDRWLFEKANTCGYACFICCFISALNATGEENDRLVTSGRKKAGLSLILWFIVCVQHFKAFSVLTVLIVVNGHNGLHKSSVLFLQNCILKVEFLLFGDIMII